MRGGGGEQETRTRILSLTGAVFTALGPSHLPVRPGEHPPVTAFAMDVRTEDSTGGGKKGKVPAQRPRVAFKTPTQHHPAPGGPPVTHILLLWGSRSQEQLSQPAGRCSAKEQTPGGREPQGNCCLLLSALLH